MGRGRGDHTPTIWITQAATSVHLRMKEKTTPAAPFRHNLGSRSTALVLRGQKPDSFRNPLSLKRGLFSLPEVSGVSS